MIQRLPQKAEKSYRELKTKNCKPTLTLPGESDKVAYC